MSDPTIAERTVDCQICGPVDTYDEAAWSAHCAHIDGAGFDADDFPDDVPS